MTNRNVVGLIAPALYKPEKCYNGFTVITPYRSDQAFRAPPVVA